MCILSSLLHCTPPKKKKRHIKGGPRASHWSDWTASTGFFGFFISAVSRRKLQRVNIGDCEDHFIGEKDTLGNIYIHICRKHSFSSYLISHFLENSPQINILCVQLSSPHMTCKVEGTWLCPIKSQPSDFTSPAKMSLTFLPCHVFIRLYIQILELLLCSLKPPSISKWST